MILAMMHHGLLRGELMNRTADIAVVAIWKSHVYLLLLLGSRYFVFVSTSFTRSIWESAVKQLAMFFSLHQKGCLGWWNI